MYTGHNIPEAADPTSVAKLLNEKDAAIKQLLEALEELVADIERWEDAVRELLGTPPEHGMKLDKARAAIAAAKQ